MHSLTLSNNISPCLFDYPLPQIIQILTVEFVFVTSIIVSDLLSFIVYWLLFAREVRSTHAQAFTKAVVRPFELKLFFHWVHSHTEQVDHRKLHEAWAQGLQFLWVLFWLVTYFLHELKFSQNSYFFGEKCKFLERFLHHRRWKSHRTFDPKIICKRILFTWKTLYFGKVDTMCCKCTQTLIQHSLSITNTKQQNWFFSSCSFLLVPYYEKSCRIFTIILNSWLDNF